MCPRYSQYGRLLKTHNSITDEMMKDKTSAFSSKSGKGPFRGYNAYTFFGTC
jgi:hypothetical protein